MEELSFQDLLKAPQSRVMKTEIEGFAIVKITELTPSEEQLHADEVAPLNEKRKSFFDRQKDFVDSLEADRSDGVEEELQALYDEITEEDDKLLSRWAARFLDGQLPSDAQLETFMANVSYAVRREIYLRGKRFNWVGDSYKEAIEKNS